MKRYDTVFLETSVIRKTLCDIKEIQEIIRERIGSSRKVTSYFVFMEFKRGLILNLVEFYTAVESLESLDEAQKWWNEEYSARKLKDVGFAISEVLKDYNSRGDKNYALETIKSIILQLFYGFYEEISDFSDNHTQCYSGKNINLPTRTMPKNKDLRQFYKYFKEDHSGKCKAEAFLKGKENITKKIMKEAENAKSNMKEALTKQEKTLKRLRNGGKYSCATCARVGDTLIALECPKKSLLLSFDGIFQHLCGISDRDFEILPSTRSVVRREDVLRELS